MNKISKNKTKSALVESVLALDEHFSELERLSALISENELRTEFDFEQSARLLVHFANCGQAVSTEVLNLSNRLNEARVKAEEAAQIVAVRAEQVQARRSDQDQKVVAFQQLAAKVNDLGREMGALKKPEGENLSDDERARLSMRLSELDLQLQPLIDEAQKLGKQAKDSKMKALEQNAESLSQSLLAVRRKLVEFRQPQSLELQQ